MPVSAWQCIFISLASCPPTRCVGLTFATFRLPHFRLNATDVAANSIPSTSCSSPVQFTNLTDGHYAFGVTPQDAVGNVGVTVVTDFVVDTQPPTVTVLAPLATRQGAATITFKADDGPVGSGIKNVTCRVRPVVLASGQSGKVNPDDPQYGWAQCSSPWNLTGLVEGHWVFSVVAYDNAGLSSSSAERDIWVDNTAPVATIADGPSK